MPFLLLYHFLGGRVFVSSTKSSLYNHFELDCDQYKCLQSFFLLIIITTRWLFILYFNCFKYQVIECGLAYLCLVYKLADQCFFLSICGLCCQTNDGNEEISQCKYVNIQHMKQSCPMITCTGIYFNLMNNDIKHVFFNN